MSKVEIESYNGNKNIYNLEQYDIAKVDDFLLLVLQLNCKNIIYKFSTDEKVSKYTDMESSIRKELSKDKAYLYEFDGRNYITVGECEFSGKKMNEVSRPLRK